MAFNMSTSITHAVNFLIRPLAFVHEPSIVHGIQTILRSALCAIAQSTPNGKIILSFSITRPPRPAHAACIATGFHWPEWMELLGGREFDLFIQPLSVVARYRGLAPSTLVYWVAPQPTQAKRSLLAHLSMPQVPISKYSQSRSPNFKERTHTLSAPPIIVPPTLFGPTLAQQLRETDDDEAEELLSMINHHTIIAPTPTREKFIAPTRIPFPSFSPISSPEPFSPASSRPSSRSSTFSVFSDDESLSSATSVGSSERLPTKPSSPRASFKREPQVFVDDTKKNAAKYLYQGGVSKTLGGGVMLGCPSSAPSTYPARAAKPPVPAPPKGGRRGGANAYSWRRSHPRA